MKNDQESFLATLGWRNSQAHRQANRFRELFGLPLAKFWHPFTGFDIIRFDDAIKPATHQSLRTCVQNRYGKDAVQLIESLIGA
jgi:hypothetical protein